MHFHASLLVTEAALTDESYCVLYVLFKMLGSETGLNYKNLEDSGMLHINSMVILCFYNKQGRNSEASVVSSNFLEVA
jgi:hypothetical protein